MPERITRDPITGEYIADLSPDAQINTNLEGITKEEYDTLIDSLTNHPEYFDNGYNGAYSEGFGEAITKVFSETFVSAAVFDQMNPEQRFNMFHNTNENRENTMSEIKELKIEKDLFDDGILSSEEMTPENIFSKLTDVISKPPVLSKTNNNTQKITRKKIQDKDTRKPSWFGGAWPTSSIFSYTEKYDLNEAASKFFGTYAISSGVGSGIAVFSAEIMGSLPIWAIILSSAGIGAGVILAIHLSCAIVNKILKHNGMVGNSHRLQGKYQNGPIDIIQGWFEKGKHIWGNLGGAMSKIGFALFGTICTVGDIATNLITAPFYGFAYLAKKMFGRNNVAVDPINVAHPISHNDINGATVVTANNGEVTAEVLNEEVPVLDNAEVLNEEVPVLDNVKAIPLAPIDLSQRKMTPIDRYTINKFIYSENIVSLKGEDAKQYDILKEKLDSKYKTCTNCSRYICNNGRYIKCNRCNEGFVHYDNVWGGCFYAIEICDMVLSSAIHCKDCDNSWQMCKGNHFSFLPETNTNKGFSVIDGPCLVSDSVALTDDEIIADNKILIGILDRNLNEEHKDEIAREPENVLDDKVNLKTTNDELNDMVPKNVRTKPSGGSKKRKNKTKRRRNKKTRRRRR